MRNDYTDDIGTKLTTAWVKSKMSVKEFITYCNDSRANVIETTDTTFHVYIERPNGEGSILTCYFIFNRWWCKM